MKRTPWNKLSTSSRERARKAGVTDIGYRAGAWVPWQRGVKPPKTRSQLAAQRSLNLYGFTPSQLRGFSPTLKETLSDAASSGADLAWLKDIPLPIRPQAFRYWRDKGRQPPQADIDLFKRNVPTWKKPLLGQEANVFFAQHKHVRDPEHRAHLIEPHLLAEPNLQRKYWYLTKEANDKVIQGANAPDWFWWYH